MPNDLQELGPRARGAVGAAEAEAIAMNYDRVGTEHLLWGVLDVEGTAGQVLRGLGVDVDRLRTALETQGSVSIAAAADRELPVRALPCPACGADLDGNLACRAVGAAGEHGPQKTLVFWCSACGHVLGATPA